MTSAEGKKEEAIATESRPKRSAPFGCKRGSELPGVRVKRETGFGPISLGASGETRGGLGRLSSPLLGFGFKMRDRERKEMT